MILNKTIKKTVFLALLMTGAAHATGQGGYFGLMVGQSNLGGQNQTVTIAPGVNVDVKPQGTGVGTRLFAGYNMNPYAAIEGGFTYYSSMTYNTTIISNNLKTRAGSFDLLGKGILPIADSGFGVFAKLGFAYMYTKTTGKVQNTEQPTTTATGFRPAAGLGVSYDISQNWVADLSYTTIRYSNSQVKNPSLIALGISYHLLDPVCGQFLC